MREEFNELPAESQADIEKHLEAQLKVVDEGIAEIEKNIIQFQNAKEVIAKLDQNKIIGKNPVDYEKMISGLELTLKEYRDARQEILEGKTIVSDSLRRKLFGADSAEKNIH